MRKVRDDREYFVHTENHTVPWHVLLIKFFIEDGCIYSLKELHKESQVVVLMSQDERESDLLRSTAGILDTPERETPSYIYISIGLYTSV